MNNKKIFYIIVLLMFLAALFESSIFLQEILRGYTSSLVGFQESNPALAIVLFILFASLSVLFGPFSSFPLVPPAIVIWGVPMTILLLFFGWLIGNSGAYFIGRYFGRFLVSKILGVEKIDNWIRSIQSRLTFGLLLLFRLSTPSETGYVFGIIKYDFYKYLMLSAIAELPFAFIAVYASEAFTRSSTLALISLLWVWVIIIIVALYFFKKASKRHA